MPELIPLFSRSDISRWVDAVAHDISRDLKDRAPIVIGVLNGSFLFLADLVRRLDFPLKIDFIRVASYGKGLQSSGNVRLTKELEIDVLDRDVLIVEDIVDSGLTLKYIIDYLKPFHPKTVSVCALIDKRERRRTTVQIDYACQTVETGFLVGYGLDYAGRYRNLPDIYHLKF